MINLKNIEIPAPHHSRVLLCDISFEISKSQKPIIVFTHGFKGFKDWGPFNEMAQYFAKQGFVFVKFNTAFNGTTKDALTEFADKEAFAQNTFTKELDDLGTVIDALHDERLLLHDTVEFNLNSIYLLGHSRGGGISLLKTAEDQRVKKLVTWASISDIESRWDPEMLPDWKKQGRIYVKNSRTGEELPLDYNLVQDFENNKFRLYLPARSKEISVPTLILHGSEDPTVNIEDARVLNQNIKDSRLEIIEGAGHTFDASHPFNGKFSVENPEESDLPENFLKAIRKTASFLKND